MAAKTKIRRIFEVGNNKAFSIYEKDYNSN